MVAEFRGAEAVANDFFARAIAVDAIAPGARYASASPMVGVTMLVEPRYDVVALALPGLKEDSIYRISEQVSPTRFGPATAA